MGPKKPARSIASNGRVTAGADKGKASSSTKTSQPPMTVVSKNGVVAAPDPISDDKAVAASHARVQTALASIGARPIRDYVDQVRLVRFRQDEQERADERRKMQRMCGIPVSSGDSSTRATSTRGVSPSPQAATQQRNVAVENNVSPLLLLPFNPCSRLGKMVSRNSFGYGGAIFEIHHGRSYVAQLNELLQAIGCDLPQYDQSTQFKSRYRSSPDFFVTCIIHTFCFVDNEGKSNVKAGKECVARMALEHFLMDPETKRIESGEDQERFFQVD